MEIEKLKGSERSVCARITAHFITGRNGQIWHKIKGKKNTHYLPCISGFSNSTAYSFRQEAQLHKHRHPKKYIRLRQIVSIGFV